MLVEITALIQNRTSILLNPGYSQSSRPEDAVLVWSASGVTTACADEKTRIQVDINTAIRDKKRLRPFIVVFPNKIKIYWKPF